MGNTGGGVKSCTSNRSVLGTAGHNHDGPQKVMALDNGGTATHSTAALPSRSTPRRQDCVRSVALMNAGHEDCSRSVKYLSENQRYDSEKPLSMTVPIPQVHCPPGKARPASSSTLPRNHPQEICIRLAYEFSVLEESKGHETQTDPADM